MGAHDGAGGRRCRDTRESGIHIKETIAVLICLGRSIHCSELRRTRRECRLDLGRGEGTVLAYEEAGRRRRDW